jgi:hypothetical protein
MLLRLFLLCGLGVLLVLKLLFFFLAAVLAEAGVSVLGAAALPAPPGLVLESALSLVIIVSSSDLKDIDIQYGYNVRCLLLIRLIESTIL